jgi:agmatine deiminase
LEIVKVDGEKCFSSEKTMAVPHKRVVGLWEPQEHVYLAYPTSQYVQKHKVHGRAIQDCQADMVKHLQRHVTVTYLVNSQAEMKDFQKYLVKHGANPDNLEFLHVPHCDIWMRDTGPIFVEMRDDKGNRSLTMPWPGFDNWGHEPYVKNGSWKHCDIPNYVQRDIANARGMAWRRVLHRVHPNGDGVYETKADQTFIGEGGDKSFNGSGTLITTTQVIFERNPNLRKSDVEEILNEYYGVKNIIWIPKGLIEDWPLFWGPIKVRKKKKGWEKVWTPIVTTGHVDEFCRFVGPNRVLLSQVHESQDGPLEMINRKRLDDAEKVLRKSRNSAGEKLEIIRIPCAPIQIMEMDTKDPQFSQLQSIRNSELNHKKKAPVLLAGSYVNFCITNGLVLMPKYYFEGESPEAWAHIDEEAKAVMEQVFPGREVVQIDVLHLNSGGGGMNCISANQPSIGE